MTVLTIGHLGSRVIKEVRMYLNTKYLPGFDVYHTEHTGDTADWSKKVIRELKDFDDKYIIFALDDYLLNAPIQQQLFKHALSKMGEFVNVKLCECTPEEQASYPVTTQYTLWDREKLIEILEHTTTPWDFEINGSKFFYEQGYKAAQVPALTYYTNSSLSKRWQGVRLDGLNEEDVRKVQQWI